MKTRMSPAVVAAVTTAVLAGSALPAAAQFKDVLVQAPRLSAPERGSVRGSLAGVGFTASELSRGAFRLPLAINAPTDRGPLQASVVPSYSPDNGLSEWGMGWNSDLSIRRHRLVGDIDYVTDDFVSPWGRLRPGSDGAFYPTGLASVMRVEPSDDDWVTTDTDGTQYRFRASSGVTTASGTYAWQLTEVVNVLGDRTTLEWTKNASGRPFLSRVTWGGRSTTAQYELAFSYDTLATAFVDHTTGATLDRRISGVKVSARDATSGELRERWHYVLGYRAAPFGPAFYLETIQRVFASGEAQPTMTYRYELDDTRLPNVALEHYTGLDTILQTLGDVALQPDRAAIDDVDADGQLDFEHAAQQDMIQHTDAGWVVSPLPATNGANSRCRPPASGSNSPRMLARMTGDIGEPNVVFTRRQATAPTTSQVLVCDRLGRPVADLVFPDDWQLGPLTRIADIDRDRRPDLVRISRSGIDILHNESDASGIRFVALPKFTWALDGAPTVAWLNDFDGDGNIDVTVRSATGLSVMFGLGQRRWTTTPTVFRFTTLAGQQLGSFSSYQVSFADANKDGLIDVLLTKGINVFMFTNRGNGFSEVPVAGLRNVQSGFGLPVVADVSGRGGIEVAFPTLGTTYLVELATPSTGLMSSADDGMGTLARFAYVRSAPRAGIEHRITLLDKLTVESSGYDPVSYQYGYGPPILHTVGKQLIGFTSVDKHSPLLDERDTFLNDDDVSGVQSLAEETDDRTPGIIRFTRRSYDEAFLNDVRWLRPSRVETGFRNTAGDVTLSSTTQYTTYEREFCPTVVVTNSPSGQLMSTTALATVTALPDDFHCLASSQTLFGAHADPSLDFHYLVNLSRNNLGQVTQVTQFDAAMHLLVLQDVGYDGNHRIASLGAPGRGTTGVTYDTLGRLDTVTDPAGVGTHVSTADPVRDVVLGLETIRPSASVMASFHYDGRERVQTSWDDFSGADAVHPLLSYAYHDPTNTTPGRIDIQTLVDAITGTSRYAVSLTAADGEQIVSASWLGDHYSLGTASIAFRNTLTKRSSLGGTMTHEALSALTSADLRALGTPVIETVEAGFGHAVQTTTTQQANVVGTMTTDLVLEPTELVTRLHQPGGFTAESAVDAAGRLVRKTDENGAIHRYRFDALGRLVHIDTPDGAHSLAFDGFGRPMRIARDGIGAITYRYDPTSGLLTRKQRLDSAGALVDTSDTTYDAIGRPLQVAQTATKETSTRSFDYDGHIGAITEPGQLGRLTRARGDGWERTELFDPLGRPYQQRISLTGWRELTCDKTFRAGGSVASDTITITDATGATRFSSTKETVLDGIGRISQLKVDGRVLYTLSYDDEGRLARADFTSGEEITFDYDAVTHERRGHSLEAPTASGGVHWDRDPRGLVKDEIYDHGDTTTRRDYDYDGRGALTSATTANSVASYTYTASGLPSSITDSAGSRSVGRVSRALTAGDTSYRWDASGRLVGKGEWTFDYGASGQLSHANRTGRQIDFVYDDGDNRVLKRVDGHPVRANVVDGVLTEDHFIEVVTVGGIVAGVLDNGQFTALLTDPRGTPFADADGTPNLASPFGVRASHLGFAEVIDYTRLGWDPDLDVVRMGVRDYDPTLSQFLTPDPLFLENLEKCQASPLQCSLYGYAAGNPLNFIDPTGLGVLSFIGDVAAGVAGGVYDMAAGAVHMVRHPIQTGAALVHMARHPIQTGEALAKAAYHAASSCIGGDGNACGHLAVDVAAVFVGGEALQGGKLASKTTKLLEGVEAAGTEVKLLEAARAAEAAEVAGGGGTRFFRGAKPGEAPNFTPKPNEFKVDRATGHVKDTHGVSVFDNPESVSSKGLVPHEVDQATIPESLRTIQRGKDPAHYEITPKPGANLTPDAFIKACGGIQCR